LSETSDDEGVEGPSDSDSESGFNAPRTQGYSCCAEAHYNCGMFTNTLKEQAKDVKESLRKVHVVNKVKRCFTLDKLKGVFPILTWGPKYR